MFYFTGVRWGLSERPFVCGDAGQGRDRLGVPRASKRNARASWSAKTAEVRVWQEDESPYRQIAGILKDRGAATGRVGVEERLRFFIFNGVKKESAGTEFVDAEAVTAGCRMIKGATELALMQKASDITIEAFRAAFQTFREGMTQDELRANIAAAHRALGAAGSASVSFGDVHGVPARQHRAAEAEGRRRHPGGWRLQRRRLSVGHHAHDGVRPGQPRGRPRSGTSRSARRRRRSRWSSRARRARRSTPRRAR